MKRGKECRYGPEGGYSLFQRDSLTLNRVTFPITVWPPLESQTVTEVCGAKSHLPWFWNSTENHYIVINIPKNNIQSTFYNNEDANNTIFCEKIQP